MATITVNEEMLKVAAPKNTLIVAREDGRMYIVDFTECPQLDDPGAIDWGLSVSKLIIGKIAFSRNRLTQLEHIEFENIQHTEQEPMPGAGDMEVTVFTTLDGKNVVQETKPYISIDEGNFVRANCRLTGTNFGIQLRGTYNVNSFVVTLHPAGRR